MIETMTNRGPDGSGSWLRQHVALGHRKLARDRGTESAQPITLNTSAGDIAIVYAGTMYNSIELRDELISHGHCFKTSDDAEIVLRGYLEWGYSVARRMRGMYALAIWDSRYSKLILIRDRRGNKPLYYYPTSDGVLFGSEPKAILSNPLARKIVDHNGLRGFFALTHTPGWSLWKGMSEVLPGTIVTVSRKGIENSTYWKLEPAPHTDNQEESILKVQELLNDVLHRQTVSRIPYSLMLSGGLDSSGIAGLLAGILAERDELLRTFSIDYSGQHVNFAPDEFRNDQDLPFINDVTNHIGSVHQNLVLKPTVHADPEVRRARIRAKDIPEGVGDMDASLYLLCRSIKKESPVVFSGDSADGLFGEYDWFNSISRSDEHTFPWLQQNKSLVNDMTRLVRPDLRKTLRLNEYIADEYATALADVEHLDDENAFERRIREITHMYLTRSVRSLLDRTERVSMAVGLEVRTPYSDHHLVEYVYNTPPALKIFDGREKSLLRQAVKHVLPRSVVGRAKSGYPSSRNPDYIRLLQQQAKEILTDISNPIFDVIDRNWLAEVAETPESCISTGTRWALDRSLDLYTWCDVYRPEIQPGG